MTTQRKAILDRLGSTGLRVRGDPGSGKTRFLRTVGSLCYKPIFASGASTASPLFRILDAFRGTSSMKATSGSVTNGRRS